MGKNISIPKGYKIKMVLEKDDCNQIIFKYVVLKKFLGFWLRLRKPALNIDTWGAKSDYYDHVRRGYIILLSDGECRTYEDALEFIHYEPFKIYMTNEQNQHIFEMWANNSIARNFVSAGTPYKKFHVSRIGLFFNALKTDASFQQKGEFWEDHFSKRFNMHKVFECHQKSSK